MRIEHPSSPHADDSIPSLYREALNILFVSWSLGAPRLPIATPLDPFCPIHGVILKAAFVRRMQAKLDHTCCIRVAWNRRYCL
jgi:hypothetical protein